MRLDLPRDTERLGAVVVHGLQKVYEIDSGLWPDAENDKDTIQHIPYKRLHAIERDMAIVVPVHGERINLVEGVITGIPNPCLVIVLSNSPRQPVDQFAMEKRAVERLARMSGKRVMVVHQKDPLLAVALRRAGYPELLDEQGEIRSGKAEGMILATLLARLAGKRSLGFVDADNHFPGAVLEYVKVYAAGLAMRHSPYAMVRIHWSSKPKVDDEGLFFAKWGRASVITNGFLNKLISERTGFGTDLIKTGNAGEHALSMDLAMVLEYAPGYAVEPYHFINLFERFADLGGTREQLGDHVEVFQIESRNPHLHDTGKGDEHIDDMLLGALQVIYHSRLAGSKLREQILAELRGRGVLGPEEVPPPLACYPAPAKVDIDVLRDALRDRPYAALFARERPLTGTELSVLIEDAAEPAGEGEIVEAS